MGALKLRVIEGGRQGEPRAKYIHARESAHRDAPGQSRAWALNVGASSKRSAAKAVVLEVLTEVAAAHGLSDGDLAASCDQPRTRVSQQLRGERTFPLEQLLCLPDEALQEVAGRLVAARAEFLTRWRAAR